jgi:hypothetical protein
LTVAPALADLQTSGWIAVEKNRFRIYFSLGPAGIYQLDQPPDSGYQLEWCELEVNGQRWLTVGLESLGDSAVLAQHFSSVMEFIAPQLQPYPLDSAHSYAYPHWLSRLRNPVQQA